MTADRKTTSRVLVAAIAVCLLLAGCGDDDDGEDAATATSSTPTSAASPPTDADDAEASDGGGDFCQLSDELTRLFGELEQNPEKIWSDIEAVVAEMHAAAPPELEADVGVAIRYYPMARAELEAADWDVSVLETLAVEYRSDHGAAEESIHAYLEANC